MDEKVEAEGTGLHEVAAVKDFGLKMDEKGVLGWWRRAMGYTN